MPSPSRALPDLIAPSDSFAYLPATLSAVCGSRRMPWSPTNRFSPSVAAARSAGEGGLSGRMVNAGWKRSVGGEGALQPPVLDEVALGKRALDGHRLLPEPCRLGLAPASPGLLPARLQAEQLLVVAERREHGDGCRHGSIPSICASRRAASCWERLPR